MHRKAKREVVKATVKAYGKLYERLDTKEGKMIADCPDGGTELGRMCSRLE